MDTLLRLLSALPSELSVLIISMIPIIELRGAIPIGAALGIPFHTNFILSVLGNMLPVPLILIFIPRILTLLDGSKLFQPLVAYLRRKADKHSKRVLGGVDNVTESESVKRGKIMTPAIFLGLLLFVALPIPGTGAWSGSLVAALFSLSRKDAFFAILLGVVICAIIMSLASYGVIGFLSFLI